MQDIRAYLARHPIFAVVLGLFAAAIVISIIQPSTHPPVNQSTSQPEQLQTNDELEEQQSTKLLMQKAQTGDAQAQYQLGKFYDQAGDECTNKGLRSATQVGGEWKISTGNADKDYVEAVKWYSLAAKQGYAPAESCLGQMYESGGGGLKKSDTEALKWYRKATAQKDPQGEFYLAQMLDPDWSGGKNPKEALRLYKLAAAQKFPEAIYTLGNYYESGNCGLPESIPEAAKWYQIGANLGDPQSQCGLADLYLRGEGIKRNDGQAFHWYKKAADAGSSDGQNMVGRLYENGWGVKQDTNQAIVWYQKSMAQGDAAAKYNLEQLQKRQAEADQAREQRKGLADTYNHAPGDDCKVVEHGTWAINSKDSYNEEIKFSIAKDDVGIEQLIEAGKLAALPGGTQVHVIDPELIGMERYLEVRVQSGDHMSEVWHVHSEDVGPPIN